MSGWPGSTAEARGGLEAGWRPAERPLASVVIVPHNMNATAQYPKHRLRTDPDQRVDRGGRRPVEPEHPLVVILARRVARSRCQTTLNTDPMATPVSFRP